MIFLAGLMKQRLFHIREIAIFGSSARIDTMRTFCSPLCCSNAVEGTAVCCLLDWRKCRDLDINATVNRCRRCTVWESQGFLAGRIGEKDSILAVSGRLGRAEIIIAEVVNEFCMSFIVEDADANYFKALLDTKVVVEGSSFRTN